MSERDERQEESTAEEQESLNSSEAEGGFERSDVPSGPSSPSEVQT